jgi:hypothetical protein
MTMLRQLITRSRRAPADDGRPTTGHFLRDEGHQDFRFATDHTLPQGPADRGDELVWVATRIELHAAAGALDDGTPHVLDAEINHRNAQWDDAVDHDAAHRTRTAKALHAEEAEHLTALLEELSGLRSETSRVRSENDHWRAVLNGAPATQLPQTTDELIATPASAGITLAVPTAAVTTAPWAPARPALDHTTAEIAPETSPGTSPDNNPDTEGEPS